MKGIKRILLAVLVAVLMTMTIPYRVQAGGLIVVNTDKDEYAKNGNCSLREAIVAANQNRVVDACAAGTPDASGTDIITFEANITQVIINREAAAGDDPTWYGDLNIISNVVISGNPNQRTAIFKGSNMTGRLFVIGSKEDVPVEQARTRGLLVASNVTLRNLMIGLPTGGGATHGGGAKVYEQSVLNVENCSFEKNFNDNGGAIYLIEGATVNVSESSFLSNQGIAGGAILSGGALNITNSYFSANKASFYGGAIHHNSRAEKATLVNVTFEHNIADNRGGAIFSDGSFIEIVNNTFVNNMGGANQAAALYFSGSGSIRNSLIFQESTQEPTCEYSLSGLAVFKSLGYNYENQNHCYTGTSGVPAPAEGDQINVDPATILVKNGANFTASIEDESLTRMFKLSKDMNTAKNCPAFDQRSVFYARNVNACDSGSYEFGAVKTVKNVYLPAVMKK